MLSLSNTLDVHTLRVKAISSVFETLLLLAKVVGVVADEGMPGYSHIRL
jgi:hypothetical protein